MSAFLILIFFSISFSCEARPEDQKVNDNQIELSDEGDMNVEGPTEENSMIEPELVLFEGDIALPINSSSNQWGGVRGTYVVNEERIWPQGAVPFKIDTTSIVAAEHQELIRQGLRELEEVATCLSFNEVTGEAVGDHIVFRSHGDHKYPGKGCWAYVGRQGGTQVINLEPPLCMDLKHIKHEVLHSLGAIHEHTRPDREKHIRILEENVEKGKLSNFKIAEWSYDDDAMGVENFGAPYDLHSIMHYPYNAYGINDSRTIEAVNPKITEFGTSNDLSLTDIMKLNLLYQCEIDSNTIVEYVHEMIIKDESDLTADILKTVEEKNDKFQEDSKNLHKKVDDQEKRIAELENANLDYKEKLNILIWEMEKMKLSLSNRDEIIDKNVEVVEDRLKSHEIESKEILSRLEARASQEILLEDTVEDLDDTVKDLSLMKDTFEDLEDTVADLSLMNLKRTCQEYADSGIKRSGYFWLDPDGPLNSPNRIRVWCNITSESVVTEVLHDSEITTNITPCAQPGCYTRNITYESSRSQIRALMEISEHCYQDIRYDCTMAPMRKGFDNTDYAFWIGDNGKKNIHWNDFDNETSSGDHFCACHSKSQCFESDVYKNKCNCDSPAAIGEFDEGRISDIKILPITQLSFGGIRPSFQSAQHTLGRLKCSGRKYMEFGSSCEALRMAGNYLSGYYNVKEGDEDVKIVFCNMTSNPWDHEGLEIFTESLAEEIEAMHSNFSTQLDQLEMAVNQTIQNVETTVRKMPGPPGRQGQKGNQGNAGSKGNKGEVGLAGRIGPKGDKGSIGLQGIRGLKGMKGDLGLLGRTGSKGEKGEIGVQGINGQNGKKGERGQTGTKGMTGNPGLKGNKGSNGLTGNSGRKGDTGQVGNKGTNGSPGMKGEKGAEGIKGESGKCGTGAHVRSCKDIKLECPDDKNGVYSIYPNGDGQNPVKVYCEMDTDGGGWTVMAYLRNKQQWDYKIFEDNGVVGDVNGGFSTGATLKGVNAAFTEKLIVYISLEELNVTLGRQWMINQRPDAVVFSGIDTKTGWSYRDSFGYTKEAAGNVCHVGCVKYDSFGLFSSDTAQGASTPGWCGTPSDKNSSGCRDGNSVCWQPRGKGLNCGVQRGRRCALLSGPGEGVIFAVR